jgi:hypothetical protein
MTDCSFVPIVFAVIGAIGLASIVACFVGLAVLVWMRIREELE